MLAKIRMYANNRVPRSLQIVLITSFALGLAIRIIEALVRKVHWAEGETANVAIAIAQGRGFADAFMPGQGPTAHLLPTTAAIAGAVYSLLGIRTPAAEAVLCGWALLLTFSCYAFFTGAFARLGASMAARVWAFAFLSVLPIFTDDETFEWRVWDGGLGLALGSATLFLLVSADGRGRLPRLGIWFGILPALTFFVNPPTGIAAFAALTLFTWRQRHVRGILRPFAGALIALALLIGGWTVRNQIVMDHPILLRDDLGMELAMANYPDVTAPADPYHNFLARLAAIQPYNHPAPFRAMIAAGGEVAYSKQLGAEAKAWMAANPGLTEILWTRHVTEMLFPRPWMFERRSKYGQHFARAWVMDLVGVAGLIGLLLALRRRDVRYLYVAAYVLIPTLCYIPFQPVERYIWLIYPPMVCLGADAIARTLWVWRGINHPRPRSRRAPVPVP